MIASVKCEATVPADETRDCGYFCISVDLSALVSGGLSATSSGGSSGGSGGGQIANARMEAADSASALAARLSDLLERFLFILALPHAL